MADLTVLQAAAALAQLHARKRGAGAIAAPAEGLPGQRRRFDAGPGERNTCYVGATTPNCWCSAVEVFSSADAVSGRATSSRVATKSVMDEYQNLRGHT